MNNDYSHLLIAGDGYISSLCAVILSQKYESLTYLRGDSFSLDPSYQSRVSGLEFHYLRSVGRLKGISTLRRLDDFTLPCPFIFHFDNQSILLGRNITENLRELSRKLGDSFHVSEEEVVFIGDRISQYLDEIGCNLARIPLRKWGLDCFRDHRGMFELILAISLRLDDSVIRSFCSLYENYIPKKLDSLCRMRVFIEIISPYFLVNNEKIDDELIEYLGNEDVNIIHDTCDGVSLQTNKLEGLSLERSKLTFYFEQLLGIGSASKGLDLKLRTDENKMIGVEFIFQAHELLYYPISRFEVCTKQSWLGSSIKSLEIQRFSQKTIATFKVSSDAILKAQDSFIEFLKQELDDFLQKLGVERLSKTIPYIINSYDANFIEQDSRTTKKALKVNRRFGYELWNDKSANLSNTCFFGQYSSSPLGKVSLFQKIIEYSVKY